MEALSQMHGSSGEAAEHPWRSRAKGRAREGSLLGEQRREGPRLGFSELEPGEAGFPNSSRVHI